MEVLILDAETKSALSAVRALGREGVVVYAASTRPTAMALHSRYVKKSFTYSSPITSQQEFINELIEWASGVDGKPMLYCFSDATYLTVSRNRTLFEEHFTLLLPSEDSVEIAFSKKETYALARTLSIPTITELGLEEVTTFPVVVKPRHTMSWSGESLKSGTVDIVFSKEELPQVVEKVVKETGEEPIIQEFIFGAECGFEMLCSQGQIQMSFAHERVRSLSPRGGASTVKRTMVDSQALTIMKLYAEKLAKALLWDGPMMVEFKINTNTKEVVLMEINGRFWGSLPLPQAAGVNFAFGYYALASRNSLPPMNPKVIQTQHFLGDCKWLLAVVFKNDPLREKLYPSRFQALQDFLRSVVFDKDDVWDVLDPKPFFVENVDVLKRMFK